MKHEFLKELDSYQLKNCNGGTKIGYWLGYGLGYLSRGSTFVGAVNLGLDWIEDYNE